MARDVAPLSLAVALAALVTAGTAAAGEAAAQGSDKEVIATGRFRLETRQVFRKTEGWFDGLRAAVLEDSQVLVVFRAKQVLEATHFGGGLAALPWRTASALHASRSRKGTDWTFPTVVPCEQQGGVSEPGLARGPDGYIYLVWMSYKGGLGHTAPHWSRTRNGLDWSEPEAMTFGGETYRCGPFFGMPYPYNVSLVFTRDGRAWLFVQEANKKALYLATCDIRRFGSFTSMEEITELPWINVLLHDLNSWDRLEPRLVSSPPYVPREGPILVELSQDASDLSWSVVPVPLRNREDAPFNDPFGGLLTEASCPVPVVNADEPTIVCWTSLGRNECAAAFMTGGETWDLPRPFAVDGVPYGRAAAWIVLGRTACGVFLTERATRRGRRRKWQLEATVPFPWPPGDLSVMSRPASVAEVPSNGPGNARVHILCPPPSMEVPVRCTTVLCAAKVTPPRLAPWLVWKLDGREVARGAVARVADLVAPGAHRIEASLGPVSAVTNTKPRSRSPRTVSPYRYYPPEFSADYSRGPGTDSFERDDTIEDLRPRLQKRP